MYCWKISLKSRAPSRWIILRQICFRSNVITGSCVLRAWVTQSVQLAEITPLLALDCLHFLRVLTKSPLIQNRAIMSMIFRNCSVSLAQRRRYPFYYENRNDEFFSAITVCTIQASFEGVYNIFRGRVFQVNFQNVIPRFLEVSVRRNLSKLNLIHHWPDICPSLMISRERSSTMYQVTSFDTKSTFIEVAHVLRQWKVDKNL